MVFTANAKCVVVVADYPCHGSEFHDSWDDEDYAKQMANSPSIKDQMQLLERMGIDFAFVQVQPQITSKMVAILREVYCSIRPPNGMDHSFNSVELDSALDVTRFADALVSRASSSLEASKSKSVVVVSNKRSEMSDFSSLFHYGPSSIMPSTALVSVAEANEGEEEEEDDDEGRDAGGEASAVELAPDVLFILEDKAKPLDWAVMDAQPELKAVRYTLHICPGVEIDWGQLKVKHCSQATTIKLAPNCFAKGAMRSSHCMIDTKIGVRLVAKMYHGEARAGSHVYAPNDVCIQVVAKYLAMQYSLNPKVDDAVDFISTCRYEITDPHYGSIPRVFTAEPFMGGKYVKYNNNTGWVNKKMAHIGETAQAFNHFTREKTYGMLMVVDLQGVGCIFTDPQIHTQSQTDAFGRGNMGMSGMGHFLATHHCNRVCASLELSPFSERPSDQTHGDQIEVECVNSVDKMMTCSCPLCGSILKVLHSKFIGAYEHGQELYCDGCMTKIEKREQRECSRCQQPTSFSPYRYEMKGMELPTLCKPCKRSPKPTE